MSLSLQFLGTGTSVGVPQIGCKCPACTSADPRDRRRRTGVYVRSGKTAFLVDTPPELREACIELCISKVDAVVVTHAHMDHIAGFDDVRRFNTLNGGTVLKCHAAPETIAAMRQVFPYITTKANTQGLFRPMIDFTPVTRAFRIGCVKVTPLPVEHGGPRTLRFDVQPFLDLAAHMAAVDHQIAGGTEIAHHQRAHGIILPVQRDDAGGRADAALEAQAAHACSGADGALGKLLGGVGNGVKNVLLGDVEAADIVEPAVVALADQRVDRAGGAADILVLRQHIADQRSGGRADAEGVGHDDGGLDGAKLFHLHQTHALAEAVDHGGGCHDLVPEQVARMRQNGGDARIHVLAVTHGDVPHLDPRDVGDQIAFAGSSLPDADAGALFQTHMTALFLA